MKKLCFIMMAVLMCTLDLMAQTRTIHGTVLDAANHEPLIGATVMPKGGQGVAADVDGKFTLRVPQGITTARVSYVGYVPVTVELKDGMVVYLESESSQLNDLVVVAYGTATKESLTGSVAVVDSKDIENRPVGSVTAALEGNAPGVMVSSTTAAGPGGSPSILVRGLNTVNGTNTPLYVVDGVVFNGGINEINPDDVESISVLKDAASCALYGSKGANGVILITTRTAKEKGKVDVTLKINQGIYQRGLPFYDTMNSNQWMNTMLTSMVNGQYSLPKNDKTLETIRKDQIEHFYDNAKVWPIYGTEDPKKVFNEKGEVILNPLAAYNDLDWWDAVSQSGYRQEYNISASAATEKYNLFSSVGYLNANGYMINTDFERFTARLNFNANPVNYFKYGINVSTSYQESQYANVDSDNLNATSNPFIYAYRAPVFPYYNHDVKTGALTYDEKGEKEWNLSSGYKPYENNIGYVMRADDQNFNALSVNASLYGTLVLPYGFEATVRGTMYRDKETYETYDNPHVGSALGFGRMQETDYMYKTHNFMQTLTWDHNYGDHHVDVLLDHENYFYDYGYHYEQVRDIVFAEGVHEFTNFANHESYSSYHIKRSTESYLGRVRYNFNQKYYGEASIRRDGTSRFAKDSRWGTFWSVGASWVMSKEKFLQHIDWLNYLKLRASYGTAGTDAAASSYAYWSLYTQRAARVDGQLVMYPSQLGNNNAKWESTKTLDIALEGTLFDNRFNFSVGYFLKKNTDLLYNVKQPASSGGTWSGSQWSILTNIGDMQNVGWEIGVSGDIIKKKDFVWHAKFDASFIKNKLVKLPATGDQWTSNLALLEGKSRYEYYMPTWAGVDQMTGRSLYEINPDSHEFMKLIDPENPRGGWEFDEAAWNDNLAGAEKAGALVKIGDRYYSTNTTYSSKELQGSSLPTVFGSFGTSASWKGINVGVLFTYSLGGKLLDSGYSSLMSYGEGKTNNYHRDLFNSWTSVPDGMTEDSPNRISKDINPQINTQYSTYDNTTSSRWLTNASYMQFKNLSISYDFPKAWTKALRLKGLNLGFLTENLFTVTSRKGINPAYNYSGGQGDYFVVARTFSFQLTARF